MGFSQAYFIIFRSYAVPEENPLETSVESTLQVGIGPRDGDISLYALHIGSGYKLAWRVTTTFTFSSYWSFFYIFLWIDRSDIKCKRSINRAQYHRQKNPIDIIAMYGVHLRILGIF
jgi:hypothetical protein